MKIQYIPNVFYRDYQKITVSIIGAGGTGSLILRQLIRLDTALKGIGKKGLHVRIFDHDNVSESNIGRQDFFTKNDIGNSKTDTIISKINITYGLDWEGYNKMIKSDSYFAVSNIIFICVDNVRSRRHIYEMISESVKQNRYLNHEFTNYYIIDCGNDFNSGQVYISNGKEIDQPESKHETISYIPNPIEEFGNDVFGEEEENIPSCSLAQALGEQDLYINSFVADAAVHSLWNMLESKFITYNSIFINLNPVEVRCNKL